MPCVECELGEEAVDRFSVHPREPGLAPGAENTEVAGGPVPT